MSRQMRGLRWKGAEVPTKNVSQFAIIEIQLPCPPKTDFARKQRNRMRKWTLCSTGPSSACGVQ